MTAMSRMFPAVSQQYPVAAAAPGTQPYASAAYYGPLFSPYQYKARPSPYSRPAGRAPLCPTGYGDAVSPAAGLYRAASAAGAPPPPPPPPPSVEYEYGAR